MFYCCCRVFFRKKKSVRQVLLGDAMCHVENPQSLLINLLIVINFTKHILAFHFRIYLETNTVFEHVSWVHIHYAYLNIVLFLKYILRTINLSTANMPCISYFLYSLNVVSHFCQSFPSVEISFFP